MDQRALLTLSTVQTIAGKAIRDLKNGGRRETRNVIELCSSLAKRPGQQDLWAVVKEATSRSDGQYEALLHRAAASVREESLKVLAANLACIAFSSAAGPNGEDRWMQHIRLAEGVEQEVARWNERGVFVFLARTNGPQSFERLAALASRNARSSFVLLVREGAPELSGLRHAARCDNVCFLLEEKALPAADLLRAERALFGVLRDYAQVRDMAAETLALRRWAEQGCLVAAYASGDGAAPSGDTNDLYQKMVKARTAGTVDIFLCDLQRDPPTVLEMVRRQRPLPGKTRGGHL